MFFNDEDDPDDDDGFKFGPYDLKTLIGYALIVWAFATSVGLALRYS